MRAFTLVELIVVITILVILWTIVFISLSGFSGNARDSSRISDLTSLSKGLDIAYIKTGSYPNPDDFFSVTYSGGLLWTQGTIGDMVINILDSAGAKLSRKPMDPLTPTTLYTYSRLAYSNAYQLKTDWEGDSVAYLMPQVYATSGNPTLTYIKGNYNGMVAKTVTGSTTYLIATPSIITSQTGATGSGLDIMTTLTNKLLIHGQTNSWGIPYVPKLIFSGWLPKNDIEYTLFATGIVAAYSGSILQRQPIIQAYIQAQATNNTSLLIELAEIFIYNVFGGKRGYSCATNPSFSNLGTLTIRTPTSTNQAWTYNTTPGNCTYVCTGGYSGSGCTIAPILPYSATTTYTTGMQFTYAGETVTVIGTGYGTGNLTAEPGCTKPDISIWQGGTNNVQIWSACNVGATVAGTGTIIQNCNGGCANLATNYSSSLANFGGYFEWGNNGNLVNATYQTSGQPACPASIDSSYSQVTNFYHYYDTINYDWCSTAKNDNLWGNTTNTSVARQWPCQTGYHMPTGGTNTTDTEWGTIYSIISSGTIGSCNQGNIFDSIRCILLLPQPGGRFSTDGLFYNQGSRGYYWSSSPGNVNAYAANLGSDGAGNINYDNFRGSGFSVRCLKN